MPKKNIYCDHIGCKKKINLIRFDCDCNKSFCSKHLNRHSHNCTKLCDHKKIIKENNPYIQPAKLIQI